MMLWISLIAIVIVALTVGIIWYDRHLERKIKEHEANNPTENHYSKK